MLWNRFELNIILFLICLEKGARTITTEVLLKQMISTIDDITDKFYKQEEQEGYQLLNQSLDMIARIMEWLIIDNIDTTPTKHLEIIKYLEEALQAMEAKDTILLADILQYELRERFQVILDALN